MRERDRRNLTRVKLQAQHKSYPPGTIQHKLQRANDETAADPPNPSEYVFETPESSLQLELYTELHTHNFRGGVFSDQVAIDTPPLETFQLLESPLLSQHEKFFVQEFKRAYQRGMGTDNIFHYIMSLDNFLKMLRRDAVARGVLSELPSTEIMIRSEGKLPTIMRISAANPPITGGYEWQKDGEITFLGIGDMRIPAAFEGYRKDWRVKNNLPPCPPSPARVERLDTESEDESPQRGKSLEILNEFLRNKNSDSETFDEVSVRGEPDSDYHD